MAALTILAAAVVMSGAAAQTAGISEPCLEYVACYNERHLDHSHMEIHHYDLFPRTASTCLTLCLEKRPTTQIVIAKLVELNERLVCGCGEKDALGNGKGSVGDLFGCDPCPEGMKKCGGRVTVSVYRVEHSGECREGLHPHPLITTTTTTTTSTTTTTGMPWPVEGKEWTEMHSKLEFLGYVELDSKQTSTLRPSILPRAGGGEADRCLATCRRQPTQQANYVFLKPVGHAIYCGCGVPGVLNSPITPTGLAVSNSFFGTEDTFAVFRAGAARHALLPPCLSVAALVVVRTVAALH